MRNPLIVIIRKAKALLFPPKKLTGTDYWTDRARKFGRRSVLNLSHGEDEYEEVTRRQKEEIFPYLRSVLSGHENTILDFGCGPGRFTPELALIISGKAIGVDIVPELISCAPPDKDTDYLVMEEGTVPLPNESVDVIWCCLVLGGIKGIVLDRTLREMQRVLKWNGVLFLVENTAEEMSVEHWAFRQFNEYKELCRFAPLERLHDYEDLGQRITVMAGRKSSINNTTANS